MSSRFSSPLLLLCSHLLVAALAVWGTGQWLSPSDEPTPVALPTEPNEPPLFRAGARTYGFHDLPSEYRRPLYEIRKMAFEQQRLLVEEAMVEAYIQQQMAASNSDRMTIQNDLMPGAEPSDAEIQAFYAENQSQSSPPLEQIRAELHTYLTAAKQEKLKRELLTRLLVDGDVQMLVEAPRYDTGPTAPN